MNDEKVRILDEARFRYVAMSRAAAASARAPVWLPSSSFLKRAAGMVRWVLWQSLQTAFYHPKRLSWLMPRMLFLGVDYAYGRTFFETYRVKVIFNSQGSPQRRISAEQALADLGGISASYQRSHLTTPNPWVGYSVDVHFAFSPMVSDLLRLSGACASQVVATGYVCDRGFTGAAPRAERLRATLKERGARFIACFLDEGSVPNKKDGYRADGYAAEDYDFLLTKLLEDPDLGLILKPKKPATLRQRLGPVSSALEAALATGWCYLYEMGTVTNTTLPCEAGLAADVTIGLLVGETASSECRLAGTPSLVLDREHIPDHPFYALGHGSVIFQSWDELWQGISDYRSDPTSIPRFGDWSNMLDSLDPFQDGRATERIGVYVGWLANGLSEGLPRDQVLEMARQKYADLWGEDKITSLKPNGSESSR